MTAPVTTVPHAYLLLPVALGALGVVFGDIGTSPLYALRESFHSTHGLEPSPANVVGILALIFWSLTLASLTSFHPPGRQRGRGGVLALV